MQRKITYQAIAPHLVGNPFSWSYCYDFCDEEATTILRAKKLGYKQFDHDDFIIGEFKDGKCIAVHIERKGRFKKNSSDFGQYVKGINESLGV